MADYLDDKNFDNTVTVAAATDMAAVSALLRKKVKIWCRVIESRESGHAGDRFLGSVPSRPQIGETVILGVGTLGLELLDYEAAVAFSLLLRPNDRRQKFWIDPRKYYRLHDQTVELFMEETEEDFTPAVTEFDPSDAGMTMISNGDGTFQTKSLPPGDFQAPAKITPLGDGLFEIGGQYRAGERVILRRKPRV